MNARRLVIVIALLGVVHNGLRALAAIEGAPRGFFNYLRPFGFRPLNATIAAQLAGVIGFLILALYLARFLWRRVSGVNSLWSSALWGVTGGALLGLIAAYVSTFADRTYGLTLFLVVPFLAGFVAVLVLEYLQPTSLNMALFVSVLSVILLGVLMIEFAIEGAICLVMALPIAIPLAMLGGVVAYALRHRPAAQSPVTMLLLIGLTPFGSAVERALKPQADIFTVTTSIDLPTSPKHVWQTVLQPSLLRPPSHPLFRAGISYPLASHIEGSGLMATRYCDFSTGKLVEPVLIWDDRRRLRFTVESNPLPMQEWTPYANMHPVHLDGFLVSKQGEFQLEPLPGGGTRLRATTWYQHHLRPARYWRWWSDYIIHQVHGMVLENIRERSSLPETAPLSR
jgi:hypothetical protein